MEPKDSTPTDLDLILDKQKEINEKLADIREYLSSKTNKLKGSSPENPCEDQKENAIYGTINQILKSQMDSNSIIDEIFYHTQTLDKVL